MVKGGIRGELISHAGQKVRGKLTTMKNVGTVVTVYVVPSSM